MHALRLLFALVRGLGAGRRDPFDPAVSARHVWPQDGNLRLRLSDRRVVGWVEVACAYLLARSRLVVPLARRGTWPAIGGHRVRFVAPIPLFAKVEVHSAITEWGETTWVVETRLRYDEQDCCVVRTHGVLVRHGREVLLRKVLPLAADPLPRIGVARRYGLRRWSSLSS